MCQQKVARELKPTLMAVHSFLVLEGKEGFDRGDIVEVDSQGHYKKHGHGLQDEVRDPQPLPPQNVAPLTEKECILLNAIYPPATRYTVYSKPGLLAWGVKFEVGDTVLARLPDDGAQQDQYATATIKWAGETHVHTRHRFGLEIMVSNRLEYVCGNCKPRNKTYPFRTTERLN